MKLQLVQLSDGKYALRCRRTTWRPSWWTSKPKYKWLAIRGIFRDAPPRFFSDKDILSNPDFAHWVRCDSPLVAAEWIAHLQANGHLLTRAQRKQRQQRFQPKVIWDDALADHAEDSA